MHRQTKEKGSFTVEASMIFTLIVFTILTLLFAFLYVQQKAYLTSAASYAAQQGAELWRDNGGSPDMGGAEGAETAGAVYYRIFDDVLMSRRSYEGYLEEETGADGKSKLVFRIDAGEDRPGHKIELIGGTLVSRLENTALKPDQTKVRFIYSNNGLRGRLTVEIIQEIKVPWGGIRKFLYGKGTLTLNGRSTAAVVEPAEYIRNVDLAVELSRRLGGKLDFMSLIERVKSKGQK